MAPGIYSCDNTKLVFSPPPGGVAWLTLQASFATGAPTSLTLTNSTVDDSVSEYLFQDGIFLMGDSQLILNGVTVTTPTLFFMEANPLEDASSGPHSARITVGQSAPPNSQPSTLSFTEIRLNQSSGLDVPATNCPGGSSCTELFDVIVRDTANLALNRAKVHNLFLEAKGNGETTAAITLSDIYNGDGENIQFPVTFTCQSTPPLVCGIGQSCCYGTPYQVSVADTQIQLFRIHINNGGTANLTRLGSSIVDFETSGGCLWEFGDNDLPVAPTNCNPNTNPTGCATKLIRKDCHKDNGSTWWYAANLTAVNVQSYAFGALDLKLATVPDAITIRDRFTRLTEITTKGGVLLNVQGQGNPPQSGSPSTKVEASALSVTGNSHITIENADFSVSDNGSFIAIPNKKAGGITTASVIVRNCTAAIKYICPIPGYPNNPCANGAFAGDGAKIYFGTPRDTSCGRPAGIPTKRGDKDICEGTGVVCYACNQDDADNHRCTLNEFVNICKNPFATGGQWPETGCPNSQP